LQTTSIQHLTHIESINPEWFLKITLPVGISFYTFQGISLIIDCLRDDIHSETKPSRPKTLSNYLYEGFFFIIFFPQLVAGPVLKAKSFFPQIAYKRINEVPLLASFKILTLGYFLKMVIANNLQNQTFMLQYPYFLSFSSEKSWVLLLGYSIQIFADFAGYSLIAVGIAKLFGYQLPANFNYPYIADSFSNFWQRWHISLSSWLRDYLYIPLGGNRKGILNTYRNLFLVMLLGGIWHGAGWNYAIWGAYHGILLCLERAATKTFPFLSSTKLSHKITRIITVFLAVSVGWIFFLIQDWNECILFINQLFNGPHSIPVKDGIKVGLYVGFVIIYYVAHIAKVTQKFPLASPTAYATMLWLLITNAGTNEAFIYFQF